MGDMRLNGYHYDITLIPRYASPKTGSFSEWIQFVGASLAASADGVSAIRSLITAICRSKSA
jgi:hypothetical protein